MSELILSAFTEGPVILAANAEANSDALIAQVAFYLLIPFAIAFSFIFFIFYRQSRETHLRRKHVELELTALRAQMNPHFMFNCLASIHLCITSGRQETAGTYLLKFSFLIRRVLENSGRRWISLKEDIEMLKAYLDLEQLRTDHVFTYSIEVDESVDVENTSVFMLLVQPFAENSIWHGFTKAVVEPHIGISIHQHEGKLYYQIEDNGVSQQNGIDQPQQNEYGKRISMGTSLVREQLKTIQQIEKREAGFEIIDKITTDGKTCGKKVQLYIPLLSLH
jgi:LytS/YehU family sensor histidine kinase